MIRNALCIFILSLTIACSGSNANNTSSTGGSAGGTDGGTAGGTAGTSGGTTGASTSGSTAGTTAGGDTQGPEVLSVTPIERSILEAGDDVIVTLSEAIDPDSIPSIAFLSRLGVTSVYDPSTLTLTFTVTNTPLFGVHPLSLQGLTDTAGNALTGALAAALPAYVSPAMSDEVLFDNDGSSVVVRVETAVIEPAGQTPRHVAVFEHKQGDNEFTLVARARIEGGLWGEEHIVYQGNLFGWRLVQAGSRALVVYTGQASGGATYVGGVTLEYGAAAIDLAVSAETTLRSNTYVQEFSAANNGNLAGISFVYSSHHYAVVFDGANAGWVAIPSNEFAYRLDNFAQAGDLAIDNTARVAVAGGKVAFGWMQRGQGLAMNAYGAVASVAAGVATFTYPIDTNPSPSADPELDSDSTKAVRSLRLVGLNRSPATFVYTWLQDPLATDHDLVQSRTFYDTAFATLPTNVFTSATTSNSIAVLVADGSEDEVVLVRAEVDGSDRTLSGKVCTLANEVMSCTSDEVISTANVPVESRFLSVATVKNSVAHRTLVSWISSNNPVLSFASYADDDELGDRFGPPVGLVVPDETPVAAVEVRALLSGDSVTMVALRETFDNPGQLAVWRLTSSWTREARALFDATKQSFPSLSQRGASALVGYATSLAHAIVHQVSSLSVGQQVDDQSFATQISLASQSVVSGPHAGVLWTKSVAGQQQLFVSELHPTDGFLAPQRLAPDVPNYSLASYAGVGTDFGLLAIYTMNNNQGDVKLFLQRVADGVPSTPELLVDSAVGTCATTSSKIVDPNSIVFQGGSDRAWLLHGPTEVENPDVGCVEGLVITANAVQRTELPLNVMPGTNDYYADAVGARFLLARLDDSDRPSLLTYRNGSWQPEVQITTTPVQRIAALYDGNDIVVLAQNDDTPNSLTAHVSLNSASFVASTVDAISNGDDLRVLRDEEGLLFLTRQTGVGVRGYRFADGAFAAQPLTFPCNNIVGISYDTWRVSAHASDMLCINEDFNVTGDPAVTAEDLGLLRFAAAGSSWSTLAERLNESTSLYSRAAAGSSPYQRAYAWQNLVGDDSSLVSRQVLAGTPAQPTTEQSSAIQRFVNDANVLRSASSLAVIFLSNDIPGQPRRLHWYGF